MYDPVSVPLKYRPDITLLFRLQSPSGIHAELGIGTEILFLPLLQTFPYVHGVPFFLRKHLCVLTLLLILQAICDSFYSYYSG